MSTHALTIHNFLIQHSDAAQYKLSAQQYNIQAIAASVYNNPDILVGNSERQSLGYGTVGVIQRQPVMWNFYVTPNGKNLFMQSLQRYKLNH
jgi:hypothetical protein